MRGEKTEGERESKGRLREKKKGRFLGEGREGSRIRKRKMEK